MNRPEGHAWPRSKIPIDRAALANVGRSVVEVREMELLFIVSVTAALLWLAFGNKKDWTGM
jgi:hypothetical protein